MKKERPRKEIRKKMRELIKTSKVVLIRREDGKIEVIKGQLNTTS